MCDHDVRTGWFVVYIEIGVHNVLCGIYFHFSDKSQSLQSVVVDISVDVRALL